MIPAKTPRCHKHQTIGDSNRCIKCGKIIRPKLGETPFQRAVREKHERQNQRRFH